MNPWLTVVGLNCDGSELSNPAALSALRNCCLIVGSSRHLQQIGARIRGITAPMQTFPSPFSELGGVLDAQRGHPVVVLASGDPLFFGVGGYLLRHLPPSEIRFLPGISSVQTAFSRIGRSWSEAVIVSVHGRPITEFTGRLHPGALYGILTDAVNTPQRLAASLVSAGYASSALWVLEDLGEASERMTCTDAETLQHSEIRFSRLNVVIAELPGERRVYSPGIDDDRFVTGRADGAGLLTKKEVRLNILSMLFSRGSGVGWDIGAGCGGVSIEWALGNPAMRVVALEQNPERVGFLRDNCRRFGVQDRVEVVCGRAPDALASMPRPDVVFVGGSDGNLGAILHECWERLSANGRLVASAVTEDSRSALYAFDSSSTACTRFSEISVRRGEKLAGRNILRPLFPVLLMQAESHG